MRMQKTDMEFVTFDATDVIMTSTSGALAYFTVGDNLNFVKDEQGSNGFIDQYMKWDFGNGVYRYLGVYEAEAYKRLNTGETYQLGSTSYAKIIANNTITLYNVSEGTGGTELTSVKAIVEWLNTYGSGAPDTDAFFGISQ